MARKKITEAMEDVGESMRNVSKATTKAVVAAKKAVVAAKKFVKARTDSGAMGTKPATFPEWRSRPGLFGVSKQAIALTNPGKQAGPSQKGSCRRRGAGKAA